MGRIFKKLPPSSPQEFLQGLLEAGITQKKCRDCALVLPLDRFGVQTLNYKSTKVGAENTYYYLRTICHGCRNKKKGHRYVIRETVSAY